MSAKQGAETNKRTNILYSIRELVGATGKGVEREGGITHVHEDINPVNIFL